MILALTLGRTTAPCLLLSKGVAYIGSLSFASRCPQFQTRSVVDIWKLDSIFIMCVLYRA